MKTHLFTVDSSRAVNVASDAIMRGETGDELLLLAQALLDMRRALDEATCPFDSTGESRQRLRQQMLGR